MRKAHSEQETAHRYREAFEAGRRAEKKGWARLSPYADRDRWIDWWFFAGWDGLEQDVAWDQFRKANERVLGAMDLAHEPETWEGTTIPKSGVRANV